jgi:uncharacterized repeat protein (TIGR03803 family)
MLRSTIPSKRHQSPIETELQKELKSCPTEKRSNETNTKHKRFEVDAWVHPKRFVRRIEHERHSQGQWKSGLFLVAMFCLASPASAQYAFSVIKSLGSTPGDGTAPFATLTKGSDGALYGTTLSGGDSGLGVIFKLSQDGSGYTNLHSFTTNAADGRFTLATPIEGSDGALYGTTQLGGSSNLGTVFRLNKDGSAYTNLHSFTGMNGDGRTPYHGLMEGSDGLLYGTTYYGGITATGGLLGFWHGFQIE